MTATKAPTTVDPARATYAHGYTDDARNMAHHTLSYIGASGTYEVSGYADGSAAHCTCPSYTHSTRRPQFCKHGEAFVAMLEHVEQQRQAERTTWELQRDETWFGHQDTLNPDQRRAMNAIRAVLRSRGVRSIGAAAKGRAALDDLFGGAA